jgi:hypothetical protein
MTDDGIGDVAQEGPLQPSESAATHHDQAGADLLGQVDDRLVAAFAHPQVGDRDASPRLLDLPDLFVEYLLSLAPEIFARCFGVNVVDGRGERAPDCDDV